MSKIVFTDEDDTVIIEPQVSEIKAGDAFELLASKVEDKVVTVPTGTTGFADEPDGTLWVEYTP